MGHPNKRYMIRSSAMKICALTNGALSPQGVAACNITHLQSNTTEGFQMKVHEGQGGDLSYDCAVT
jgi:hypothetical protein